MRESWSQGLGCMYMCVFIPETQIPNAPPQTPCSSIVSFVQRHLGLAYYNSFSKSWHLGTSGALLYLPALLLIPSCSASPFSSADVHIQSICSVLALFLHTERQEAQEA
jgi:hypothetical protein